MKICSLYGVGFYYIPGTDMCLKVGGWARFEVGYGYNGSFTNEFYNNNVNNRTTNDNNWRVKGIASFDARSQTEYGTVRSYITLGVSTNVNGDDGAATADLCQPLVHPMGRLHDRSLDVVLRLLQHRRQPIRRRQLWFRHG